MIRVNLIPHRAEFRQQQIIEYIIVFTATVLLAIGIVVLVDVAYTSSLSDLKSEKSSLVAQNRLLIKKIGELRNLDALRKDVEGKLAIVDELQAGRFRSLTTLDSIAQAIPQNIWLESLNDKEGMISLTGLGESSQALANFMRSLQASDWFVDVSLVNDLEVLVEDQKVRSFSLTFRRLSLIEKEANEKAKSEAKDES